MPTQLQKQESKVINLFAKNVDVLEAVLPDHVTPQKLLRILSQEIRRNPAIATCSMTSILSSVVQGCIYGLEIGSVKGHAYLVPYGKECTLVVGYKGFVWLALNSREVTKIESRAVFEGDDFTYAYGLEPYIVHHPGSANTTDFDKLTHVYSIAWLANGEKQFDVMTRDEVLRIKDDKAKAKSGPWKTDPIEMAKKCPIRRLSKLLPLQLLQDVAQFDEAGDRGDQESLTDFLEGEYDILDDKAETAPRGNAAGKQALKDKPANKPDSPPAPPPPAPDVDESYGDLIPPDDSTIDVPADPNEPTEFEKFDIRISECDQPGQVKALLATITAAQTISDDEREELQKRAHAREHELTKGA